MGIFNFTFDDVEEVAEHLRNYCYKFSAKFDRVLEKIKVKGMKKFLPQDKNHEYDIHFGSDRVVAIFATEDEIEYIWQDGGENCFGYEVITVDKEEIADAIAEYPQYVKDGGCLDVSQWLFEEYCDSWLSISYDVLTTIGRIWR